VNAYDFLGREPLSLRQLRQIGPVFSAIENRRLLDGARLRLAGFPAVRAKRSPSPASAITWDEASPTMIGPGSKRAMPRAMARWPGFSAAAL
jgi:hypothetical protein